MNYFITAIGTDCGKTVASAILAEALGADYWKPIQVGKPTDSEKIIELVSKKITVHPERFALNTPAAPHAAAKIEGVDIRLEDFQIPETNNDLIIEGAGGVMVPLNENEFIIDLIKKFNAEIILVSNIYLGSINHTLLTLELLKAHNCKVSGIIFNGIDNQSTKSIILKHTQTPCILNIFQEEQLNEVVIKKYAAQLDINELVGER